MVTLQIRSRELGYRYVVREIDWCEVWTPDHMLLAEFPAHLVLAMLLQHLAAADTVCEITRGAGGGGGQSVALVSRAAPSAHE